MWRSSSAARGPSSASSASGGAGARRPGSRGPASRRGAASERRGSMAVSRRQAAVVVLGTISLALVACDTLLGLGQYDEVACAVPCDSGPEGGGLPMPDASDGAMLIES